MELKPGTQIKNYVLERQLGAGASGEVWKASDGVKSVALKLMNEHLLKSANAQKHRQRLEREIESLRRLNHPNIPELYEYDLDYERPYLVMRYIGGDSYEKLIANGKLMRISLQRRIDIIGEVAMALRVAHDAGIIHRDLKPANITGTENPYLLDFSVALDEDSLEKTGAGIGTALYMAVDGPPDTLNDIFGFVLVSYEIIFGRHAIFAPGDPLARGPMAALEALNRIKARTWFMPSKIARDQLPPELLNVDLEKLDEVFQKGLGDRATRYTDPREFARELRLVLTAPARPSTPASAAPPEGGTSVDSESRALPIPKLESSPPPAAKPPPAAEPPAAAAAPPQPVPPVTPPPAPPPAAQPPAAPVSKEYQKTEMFEAPVIPPTPPATPASKQYEKTEMFEAPVTPPPPATPASKQYEKTEMFEAPVTPPPATPASQDARRYEKTEMFEAPVTPPPPAASRDARRYEKTEMFETPVTPPPAARDPRLYEKTAMFDVSGVMPAAVDSPAQQAVAPQTAPVSSQPMTSRTKKGGGRGLIFVVLGLVAVVAVVAVALIASQGTGGTATATPEVVPTGTDTGAAAVVASETPQPTAAPTDAPTDSPTDSPTETPTERPTNTATPAPTNTAVLPTLEGTPRPFAALTRYEQCFSADADRGGSVDETDLAFVSERLGTRQGDAGFESDYDVNGDGVVDDADVEVVLVHLGQTCLEELCTQLDLTQDGRVDAADLDVVRGALGAVSGTDRYNEAADFNADGLIDAADIERVTENLDRDCSQ
jgi:serine/threonine protein kinase